MQFLLMSEQQVPSGKASRTVRAFKWLFLGVRPLMALEMFQSREGATACRTDMGSRLIRFRGWDITRLTIDLGLFLGVFRSYHQAFGKEMSARSFWIAGTHQACLRGSR